MRHSRVRGAGLPRRGEATPALAAGGVGILPDRGGGGWPAQTKHREEDGKPERCGRWPAQTKHREEDGRPERCEVWCARQDSNLWPSAPEADALSS